MEKIKSVTRLLLESGFSKQDILFFKKQSKKSGIDYKKEIYLSGKAALKTISMLLVLLIIWIIWSLIAKTIEDTLIIVYLFSIISFVSLALKKNRDYIKALIYFLKYNQLF